VLRQSFKRNGEFLDQVLYSIVAEEWKASTDIRFAPVARRVH
jgi:hypothetical protein